ncbi:hypothetical protein LMG19282_01450 [Cupriavidus campinensis]|uniref:Uncharacterized protein n=1 Tax=Cupriavidus campinensis TaxID=151783 RepID=A0ABY3EJQ3_9BURK|nr:hypothetical protein [Cupriavidus campinensis]TSP11022.1 hypothetical protein FGG12_19360 [Cupriavidus campinensis]CAG2138132.1 hypothetical protein LMG19282_01450 [Cupriavidus campinensis]
MEQPAFDLATLRLTTNQYLEYRRAGYNHNGAIHQLALWARGTFNLSLRDATQLARDAAEDA